MDPTCQPPLFYPFLSPTPCPPLSVPILSLSMRRRASPSSPARLRVSSPGGGGAPHPPPSALAGAALLLVLPQRRIFSLLLARHPSPARPSSSYLAGAALLVLPRRRLQQICPPRPLRRPGGIRPAWAPAWRDLRIVVGHATMREERKMGRFRKGTRMIS